MTHDSPDGPITTEEEFETALRQLLVEAMRNDVDPKGSWVSRNGASVSDLEVMVVELEKPDDAE